MTARDINKSNRALELYEKGIEPVAIAERLGIQSSHVAVYVRAAKARRERASRVVNRPQE